MNKKPRNTTNEIKNNPMDFLVKAMVMGTSNAIEHQEKDGQADFINSETLPVKCLDKDWQKKFAKFGMKFGQVVADDPLFQYVELPPGWKKVSTEHSMWSNLVDDKGRKRASIFYKAAFYDRSAHISLARRYGFDWDNEAVEKNVYRYIIKDYGQDTTLAIIELPFDAKYSEKYYTAEEEARKKAIEWLNKHYPKWENAVSYWD